MLKRCVVQVASQKRTRRLMKINLLLDGNGRRQDPTHTDTSFLCSIPSSEVLGSDPEQRVTTKGRVGLADLEL